jgi:hypothetical protein
MTKEQRARGAFLSSGPRFGSGRPRATGPAGRAIRDCARRLRGAAQIAEHDPEAVAKELRDVAARLEEWA